MHEYVINIHVHTKYSNGNNSHADIVEAASKTGLDVIVITDSNVLVEGPAGYWNVPGEDGDKSVLVISGEEIYDQTLSPKVNHLLVLGTKEEFSNFAATPQILIDNTHQSGGLTFLAHPFDPSATDNNQSGHPWTAWEVNGFTGMEIWNGYSEFKSRASNKIKTLYFAFNRKAIAQEPFPETIDKWDDLLSKGERVVAIGGSNAYPKQIKFGPIEWTIFPLEFHFKSINTHILTHEPLKGDAAADENLILGALRKGNAFVANDLHGSTRGFRFTAHTIDGFSCMGDEVSLGNGVTLQIRLPQPVETHLIKDGMVIKKLTNRETYAYNATKPGVYRVVAYIKIRGRRRAWIYSNPIYIRD